ncbi:hypothetical protein EW026_g272 [Hermanssonia centrifuga]|uniref:PB1 domain-containing protein n=1 Tax=Hermanssonia centrifuga TaxID=98765 RepID=A0A4V6S129_9APHY|nr:hypothetical protein EW026_g272 [Hermanssonia centrifuga]
MSRTLFKFSMPPDGATRRVMFQTTPSWNELAAKIESLYDIPVRTLAVAYIDSDGDEVTLSSEEELQDYYKFNAPSTPPGALAGNDALKAIRFTVRNLSAARDSEADKPLPQTPLSSNHRNTFGTNGFNGMVFDNDDDWQRIQRFAIPHDVFVPYSAESDDAPHAFVELLESDVSGTKELTDKDTASTISDSDYDALKVDKGKGKENVETIPDDDVSRVSVVEERSPDKHPVHVRLTSQASTEDIFGAHKSSEVPLSIPEETDSTPMALDGADNSNNAPDPPLPEFDDIPATTPAPSLANDVAGLFNTFSSIFASHPELSESLQNIARNASSGAYWAAHRAAIERAAQEVRHSAAQAAGEAQRGAEQGVEELRRATEEAHRAAEEAAGRRVTEAIGNVLRTIGQYTGFAGPEAQAADEPVTSTPVRDDTTPFPQRRQQPFRRETWHSWAPPRGGMFNG